MPVHDPCVPTEPLRRKRRGSLAIALGRFRETRHDEGLWITRERPRVSAHLGIEQNGLPRRISLLGVADRPSVAQAQDERIGAAAGALSSLSANPTMLDASRLQLDDRGLVEIRRLDSQADPAGQLATAFHELLLGGLRRLLALPQQDRLGASVLSVVEGDVAGEAVVLAQHRDHGLADCLNRALTLLGVGARKRDQSCVHRVLLSMAVTARCYETVIIGAAIASADELG